MTDLVKKPSPSSEPDTAEPVVVDSRRERVLGLVQQQGGAAVLVVVFVAACIFSGGFADTGNFESILVGNADTALLALGMTFVIISGGIDLSVGSVFALGGVLAAWGVHHGGTGVAIVVPIVGGAVFGTVQGLLVARARLAPFIVTLAGLLFARGLLQAMTDEGSKTYTVAPHTPFLALGDGTWRPIITAIVKRRPSGAQAMPNGGRGTLERISGTAWSEVPGIAP